MPEEKRPHPLKIARLKLGYTQAILADFMQVGVATVQRAEAGRPLRVDVIHQICNYFSERYQRQVAPQELGLVYERDKGASASNSSEISSYSQQEHSELETESSEDMNRRVALQLMSVAGTSLIINPSLQEIEKLFAHKMMRLQSWILESLEDGTRLRWQLYYTSNNKLTEEGLLNQIMKLEQLVDDSGKEHVRACRILAQNYQLAGSLARDKFHYTGARDYFVKAQQVADESHLPDMSATAIARQALAFLRQEHIEKALKLYQYAATIAEHAEPLTKAYILSGLAEALARNKYSDACYRTLDQAELLLDRAQNTPPEEDFAYVHLTMQSLEDARGECYVLLGDGQRGLEYLLAAQNQLDYKMSRNHCRLLMQQAEAFLVAGQPDECVNHALQGLQIARTIESTSNINWSREIYTKLQQSRWKSEPVVDTLLKAINS